MFKAPQEGDLLMDAPEVNGSWKLLTTYACDKEYWKARVRGLKGQPRIDVNLQHSGVRRSRRIAGEPAPAIVTERQTKTKAKTSEAEKYRKRDEHETLLRPATKEAQKKRWERERTRSPRARSRKKTGGLQTNRGLPKHTHTSLCTTAQQRQQKHFFAPNVQSACQRRRLNSSSQCYELKCCCRGRQPQMTKVC